jgi:hypothetical protein
MLGWIVRILLIVAGSITSWFVARDALNFNIIQMVVAVFLVTLAVMVAAFWQELSDLINRIRKKYKKT